MNLSQKNISFILLISITLFPALYSAQANSYSALSSSSAQPQTVTAMVSQSTATQEQAAKSKSDQASEEIARVATKGALGSLLYERGKSYFKGDGVTQDYRRARDYFEQAVDKGDADALFSLYRMGADGLGELSQNSEWARYYKRRVAENGCEQALAELDARELYDIGLTYITGWYQGVKNDCHVSRGPQDVKLGCVYLQKAVNKAVDERDARVLFDIGHIYSMGDYGFEKDCKFAHECFQEAAKFGDANVCYKLGMVWHDGDGVDKNLEMAFKLFQKAAKEEHSDAFYMLGYMCYCGELGARDLKSALKYLTKAVKLDSRNSEALYLLGRMYHWGEGVSRDEDQAFSYYKCAADLDHPGASYELGCHLLDLPHDDLAVDEEAFAHFRDAANGGDAGAFYRLGRMYWTGVGTKCDLKSALDYLLRAADKDNVEACCFLSMLYCRGCAEAGVVPDRNTCLQYRKRAFEQEGILQAAVTLHRDTFCYFARMYHRGVASNLAKALEYYQYAALLGDKEAMEVFCKAWKVKLLPQDEEHEKLCECLEKRYCENFFIGTSFESIRLNHVEDEEEFDYSEPEYEREKRKERREQLRLQFERKEKKEAMQSSIDCKIQLHDGVGVYCAGEKCSICFESFQSSTTISILPCFHIFCSACIQSWFGAGNDTCPSCRTQVIRSFAGRVMQAERAAASTAAGSKTDSKEARG